MILTITLQEVLNDVKETKLLRGLSSSLDSRVAYLIEEVDEVIQQVNAVKSNSTDETRDGLGREIYDVIWNLIDLADMLDVDLEKAARAKMTHNRVRKDWD